MNYQTILNVFGTLLAVTGCSLVLPIGCSLFYGESDLAALIMTAILLLGLGLPLRRIFKHREELSLKEGILIAIMGWTIISAASALPFIFHGSIPSFTDAFFEMMSGYTTTGATILNDIEALPHGLLFWRSQTHLLGGMGFLTLTILFLPHGMGGLRIFRAEASPGQVITKEKFVARNKDAMIWLWGIYLGLNIILSILLWLGPMDLFNAVTTSFGTVSTSGYSVKNASIGHYHSPYVDWLVILFMFLGGVTFVLFFRMLKGDISWVKTNTEFHWYVAITVFFSLAVTFILWTQHDYDNLLDALRYGTFQVVSLLTTTGYTTADYSLWHRAAIMFLYMVCFIGACAGSTTSGIKTVHYVLIGKYMYAAIKKIYIQPMSVTSIRLNGRPVERLMVDLAICYFIANMLLIFIGSCCISYLENLDYATSISVIIATLMNIGPGFGGIGPAETYAFFSPAAKWFLAWNMLVGRLEMFSALVIFMPAFWKK
ncbi:MAG: potassium transporter [Deltaproteobacteria bacterium]|nr:MAG: potassium transporter [Deltaproteobacteria bacterium]